MSWVSVSRYNYLITRLRTQCGLPDLILLAKWWWWHNIATNNQGCCWPYVQCHIPAFVVTGVHSVFYCFYKCFKFTRNCILIKTIQRKSCVYLCQSKYLSYLLNPLKYLEYFNFLVTLRKKQEICRTWGGEGRGVTPSGSDRISPLSPAPALRVQLGLGRTGTGPQVILCSHWSRQITWPEHWPLIGPGRGGQYSRAWTPAASCPG